MSSFEQETANVIRDVIALPEGERVKAINEVARDLAAGGNLAPEVVVAAQMAKAIETFNKVADHLGCHDEDSKLSMKMSEFDSVPSNVRDGVKARQIAGVYFNSWPLAKGAAIGEPPPVTPRQMKQREWVINEKRRTRRIQECLEEWLETNPTRTTISAYDSWRKERNTGLAKGEPRYLAPTSIITYTSQSWPDIVADAKAGTLKLPLLKSGDPLASERSSEADTEVGEPLDFELAAPAELEFDPKLIARRVREARAARHYTQKRLAILSGLPNHTVERVEDGQQGSRIYLRTIQRLSKALNVPLDFFASPDGKSGLPPRRGHGQAQKRA